MAWLVIPQKMKEWSLWALWWLLLGGAALWLLVGSVSYWVIHDWLPADAAGWAQALGALVAVAVAIAVPYWQRVKDDQQRREADFLQRKQRLESVSELVRHQIELIAELKDRPNREYRSITDVAEALFALKLEQNDRELQRMPVDAFGSQHISALLAIKGAAGLMLVIYRAVPGDFLSYWHRLRASHSTLLALRDRLLEEEEGLFAEFCKPYH